MGCLPVLCPWEVAVGRVLPSPFRALLKGLWAPICRSHCPSCSLLGKGSDQLRGHRGPHRPTAHGPKKRIAPQKWEDAQREKQDWGRRSGLSSCPCLGRNHPCPGSAPYPHPCSGAGRGLGMSPPLSPLVKTSRSIY